MDVIWRACLERFRQELPRQQFETWIKPLRAVIGEGSVELFAPNRFVLQWIKDRYLGRINQLVSEHFSAAMDVRLSVEDVTTARATQSSPTATVTRREPEKPAAASPVTTRSDSGINPTFTFSSFVPGRANQLARAAALQVAENPGGAYNPLFIYGGVGLGKTHLIQAVGNQLLSLNPSAKVRYVHAEQYVSDVVRAYQHKAFDAFKRLYHSLDLLLIDDIQFFGGKARTQEEFFFAFNALIEARRQIIITCDSFPKELAGIEERLISRFGWGLTVAIEPPELEMRVAILISKAVSEGIQLDEAVAFFIAKHIRSNVRELEGALKRVMAYARFIGEGITLASTKEALKDLLALQNRQISLENIQKTVADYYKIKVADMFSKKRNRSIARPRQVAMALAKELTQLSLPEIGEAFGGRDHTTVLHACRKIAELQSVDVELHRDMLTLTQTLRG